VYVCMYVCMYVPCLSLDVCSVANTYCEPVKLVQCSEAELLWAAGMCVRESVCMCLCMHVCMYVCMYACMYVVMVIRITRATSLIRIISLGY